MFEQLQADSDEIIVVTPALPMKPEKSQRRSAQWFMILNGPMIFRRPGILPSPSVRRLDLGAGR